MAVLSMQKIRLVVHQNDVDRLLELVQKSAAVEFIDIESEELVEVTVVFDNQELLSQVQQAIAFLEQHEVAPGMWSKLRNGTFTTMTETAIKGQVTDTVAITKTIETITTLQQEHAALQNTIATLTDQKSQLEAWQSLSFAISDCKTATTNTYLLEYSGKSAAEGVAAVVTLTERIDAKSLPASVNKVSDTKLALTVHTDSVDQTVVNELLNGLDLNIVPMLPGKESPATELTRVQTELAAKQSVLAECTEQCVTAAGKYLANLRLTGEVLSWERDRVMTLANAKATSETRVMDAWIVADYRPTLEQLIASEKLAVVIQDLELEADEEPPVEIKNSEFFKPFEVVTRLYGMPGYKDLDPTAFLAGFFFLFFGLSLTDVGYGAFLMIVSIGALVMFKLTSIVRTFVKLLFLMGLGSFLVGLLFGGYLGIAPEVLPESLKAIQLFDPIGNPLPVFYLALGLGVFQVMVGMILKIYSEARNGRLVSGILDTGPWLFVFCLGIAYVGVVTGYISGITTTQIVNLIYIGVALIVVSSGRHGSTIFEMLQKSLLSLYDSIGYFSDILSYSRLLALGLATTALAFAVNLIAEIVSNSVPYLGPVLAIGVLIVGHLFTLAVNTLGAFIHSARLQFVEFFGKFINGTGREFKPLARSYRYIAADDESQAT